MLFVQRLNEIELLALRVFIELLVLQVADHLVRLSDGIVEVRALMLAGRKPERARPSPPLGRG